MTGIWRTALTRRWLTLLLVAVLIAGGMTALGVWQLGVYRSKTSAATAKRAAQAPVPIQSLMSVDDALSERAVGRKVTVTGQWAPAADQVFVADREYDGRPGYWVVTPVLVDDGVGVLVVRGWVPALDAAAAAAPTGPVTVVGSVVVSEAEDASGAAAEGRVLPSLRLPTIVGMVRYRLYDSFVMEASATPAPAAAPEVVAPPAPPTDRAGFRNVAYAVQWWIFAAFVLFMWWRMMADDHRGRAAEGAGTVSA